MAKLKSPRSHGLSRNHGDTSNLFLFLRVDFVWNVYTHKIIQSQNKRKKATKDKNTLWDSHVENLCSVYKVSFWTMANLHCTRVRACCERRCKRHEMKDVGNWAKICAGGFIYGHFWRRMEWVIANVSRRTPGGIEMWWIICIANQHVTCTLVLR